jgi:hypothetical protein
MNPVEVATAVKEKVNANIVRMTKTNVKTNTVEASNSELDDQKSPKSDKDSPKAPATKTPVMKSAAEMAITNSSSLKDIN